MPFNGLTSQPSVNHPFLAPGIVTAWPRLAASEAKGRLGESRRRFLDGGRVEPDGRRPGRKQHSTGSTTLSYIFMEGKLLAQIDSSGNIYYAHDNQVGAPQKITNSAMTIVWDYETEPFGETYATPTNTDPTNHRFPGQYADVENLLSYNMARDYDTTLGRYIEHDPLGFGGGYNLFSYTGQNPVQSVDPSGLRDFTLTDMNDFAALQDYAVANPAKSGEANAAILNLAMAIDAVPENASDPAGLSAAMDAISLAGDAAYGNPGQTVTVASNGDTITAAPTDNKCNILPAEVYANGAGIGLGGDNGYPVTGRYLGIGGLWGSVNAVSADDLSSADVSIEDFQVMADSPDIGDIVAFGRPGASHVTMSLGEDIVIYAGPQGVKLGTISGTFGNRTPIVRSYTPSP